jgi:hypothetical protein
VVAARAFIPSLAIGAGGTSGFRPIAPRTAMITQLRTIVTVRATLTQGTRTVAIIGPATEEAGKRRA